MNRIDISPEVIDSLRMGRPIVALESAVLTTGLPRTPLQRSPACDAPGWRSDQPTNVEIAFLMQRLVRECGAVPAMVAVIEGRLCVGLDDSQITQLAADESAPKASVHNLAEVMTNRKSAGTTVSATLVACGRIGPIRVFATGGIGGVHRRWQEHPDISGDLDQLARTPTCVVSAGAKSILDLPATLQRLETLNVPVVGYGTDHFPRFHCLGSESMPVPIRLDEPRAIAELCRTHWQSLGLSSGVLVANPIPKEAALDEQELETAIQEAEEKALTQGVHGAARTPFLLNELARLTDGRTLEANIALLASNAKLAAQIAMAMVKKPS